MSIAGSRITTAANWRRRGRITRRLLRSTRSASRPTTIVRIWSFAWAELEAAISDYSKVIAIDAKFASAYNGRGNALRESGHVDRAIADYDEAISLDPKSPFAYNGRGNALRDKGQIDAAIKDYDQADPPGSEVHDRIDRPCQRVQRQGPMAGRAQGLRRRDRAWIRRMRPPTTIAEAPTRTMGDLDRAIEDYNAALTLDPPARRVLFQSCARLPSQRRIRSGRGGLQRDNSTRCELCLRLPQPRTAVARQKAISIAPSRITPRRFRSTRSTRRATSRGGRRRCERETLARRSMICGRACVSMIDQPAAASPWRRPTRSCGCTRRLAPSWIAPSRWIRLRRRRYYSAPASSRRRVICGGGEGLRAALALDPQLDGAREALKRARRASEDRAVEKPTTAGGRFNRVALVIGNGNYTTVPRLAERQARRRCGCGGAPEDRLPAGDPGCGPDRVRAWWQPCAASASSPTSAEWAVVYYAGHGIEIDGVNYIVPVDARLDDRSRHSGRGSGPDPVLGRSRCERSN